MHANAADGRTYCLSQIDSSALPFNVPYFCAVVQCDECRIIGSMRNLHPEVLRIYRRVNRQLLAIARGTNPALAQREDFLPPC